MRFFVFFSLFLESYASSNRQVWRWLVVRGKPREKRRKGEHGVATEAAENREGAYRSRKAYRQRRRERRMETSCFVTTDFFHDAFLHRVTQEGIVCPRYTNDVSAIYDAPLADTSAVNHKYFSVASPRSSISQWLVASFNKNVYDSIENTYRWD